MAGPMNSISDPLPRSGDCDCMAQAGADFAIHNLVGGAIVSPHVGWQHDVDGISPGPGGPFLEGRKAVSIGVRATIRESWEADLSWTSFFGAGRYNTINDRDFIAGTLKFTF